MRKFSQAQEKSPQIEKKLMPRPDSRNFAEDESSYLTQKNVAESMEIVKI